MHPPASTYRLQLNRLCPLEKVQKALPYLHALGASWLYLSPITQANPGSMHDYDVTNPNQINGEIGNSKSFSQFVAKLKKLSLGLLLDFVPNHMAATTNNPWWQDVLAHGATSKYAKFFDILHFPTPGEKLTYRRFFDVEELVCLRMEDQEVFTQTHQLVLQLIKNQQVTGLRLDHIDGLKNPEGYLNLLSTTIDKPFYILVEKILARNESLPNTWPTNGTTGYDFLNELNQLFIHAAGYETLLNHYEAMLTDTQDLTDISDIRYRNNRLIILSSFANEFNNLVQSFQHLAHWQQKHFSPQEIENLLLEICDVIPVYRTYIHQYPISAHDQHIIDAILAKVHRQHLNPECLQFFIEVVTCPHPDTTPLDTQQAWLNWLTNWQVFTGPVVAKGYEDTTCYQFNPLLSLNEVGSEPLFFNYETMGDVSVFHRYNCNKQLHFPTSLNATSTHDTKHSEDVRARLNVLTEMPEEWHQAVLRWHYWNLPNKTIIDGQLAPDTNDEILLYQSLLGAWPLNPATLTQFKARLHNFLTKAEREAKIHSNWRQPNADYEAACQAFFDAIISDNPDNYFLADFLKLQQKIAFFGMYNSLAQVALKITCPGIPDIYQGNEIWQFDLVDPDNRHPVDFTQLAQLLHSALENPIPTLLNNWPDGRIKLFLTHKLLCFRRDYPQLFIEGQYLPLTVNGTKAHHLLAFARQHQDHWLIVAVPRWFMQLGYNDNHPLDAQIFNNTQLLLPPDAPSNWHNIITDEIITSAQKPFEHYFDAAAIFNPLPVVVLTNHD